MSVNVNISDLFFNTDLSGAAILDEAGQFIGFDTDALNTEAEIFLTCLDRCGYRCGVVPPTAGELVADFLARV